MAKKLIKAQKRVEEAEQELAAAKEALAAEETKVPLPAVLSEFCSFAVFSMWTWGDHTQTRRPIE